VVIAVSGLVRAGTDVYLPPFGSLVVGYVAASGANPAAIQPYIAAGTNPQRVAVVKEFKEPFGTVHKYAAYTLMAFILLHIFFVVLGEVKEGGSIISAMFTGSKVMDKEPVDLQ
jgi:cytochrome b